MIKYQNGIMDSLFRSHLWIGGVGALKDVVEMQKSGLVVRDGSAQTCARKRQSSRRRQAAARSLPSL